MKPTRRKPETNGWMKLHNLLHYIPKDVSFGWYNTTSTYLWMGGERASQPVVVVSWQMQPTPVIPSHLMRERPYQPVYSPISLLLASLQ